MRDHDLGRVRGRRGAAAGTLPSSAPGCATGRSEAIMANTTASAIGTNRKPATPGSKNIGTNDDADAEQRDEGRRARSAARRRGSRWRTSLPCSRCQLMFSMVTVASSTRMPTASARPPSVMMFSVWPTAESAAIEARIASGIEVAMITVERQLPRNSRIIRLVSAAAITPSLHHARRSPPSRTATGRSAAATCSDGGSVSLSLRQQPP